MAKENRPADQAEEIKETETPVEVIEELSEVNEEPQETDEPSEAEKVSEESDEAVEVEEEAEESDAAVEIEEAVEESDEAVEIEEEAEESDEAVEVEEEIEESDEEDVEEINEETVEEADEEDVEETNEEANEEAVEEIDEETVEEIDEETVEEIDEETVEEADEETDKAVEVEEVTEESDEAVEVEEEVEESDEALDEAEENDEDSDDEALDEVEEEDEGSDNDELEEVDEDDYLDYDEDEPKKIVSGKAALITMLATFCLSILAVVGAFVFASRFQRSMNIPLVSYTDRFNACNTNEFTYGSMLGIESVSFSDAESTFSAQDIKDLKSGKTVTKFDGMVNIDADVRFGKLVSLDISFNSEIDNTENPSGYYTLLAGNVMSGLISNIESSDYGFMLAYTVLSYSIPVEGRDNVFLYQIDDMNFYVDYSNAMETSEIKDITIHVENAEPHYLDTSTIDTSWLPWNRDAVSESDVPSEGISEEAVVVSESDN